MIQIQFSNPKQHETVDYDGGAVEFGRGPGHGTFRIQLKDGYVSRDQLRLEPLDEARVLMINLSTRVPVKLENEAVIDPGSRKEVALPTRFVVGESSFEIHRKGEKSDSRPSYQNVLSENFQTIHSPIRTGPEDQAESTPSLSTLADSDDLQTLARWFERLSEVQRAAADSEQFYEITARALVDMVGLDCGYVLKRDGDSWEILSCHMAGDAPKTAFSPTVLQHIAEHRRTFYQDGEHQIAAQTLSDISAVVASPVLQGDAVIGAIYGVRSVTKDGTPQAIRPLEAHVVQALAAAVGTGRARLHHEHEAAQKKILIKQFFSELLAEELDRDPSLLDGRDQEVTVLFSDIRNFSGLSEKMDARQTCDFVRSVMSKLTDRVREFEGVVTSYLGDGLLAMWNAPVEQADHAERACRAALAMIGELPSLNEEWRPILGTDMRVGIGINTGPCMVGNTGSTHKFHYGPLGHTVNLASRVEATTKKLGLPILISDGTCRHLDGSLPTRRLCHAYLAGMAQSTLLHELYTGEDSTWDARRTVYQEALDLYEQRCFAEACEKLFPLLGRAQKEHDLPTLILANQCLAGIQTPAEEFDAAWSLAHK